MLEALRCSLVAFQRLTNGRTTKSNSYYQFQLFNTGLSNVQIDLNHYKYSTQPALYI